MSNLEILKQTLSAANPEDPFTKEMSAHYNFLLKEQSEPYFQIGMYKSTLERVLKISGDQLPDYLKEEIQKMIDL